VKNDRVQVHFDDRIKRFVTEMHLDNGDIIRLDRLPSIMGPLLDIATTRPGTNKDERLPMLTADEAMLLAHIMAAEAADMERETQ
jgi:hypothetical protein